MDSFETKKAALFEAWKRGLLTYKLDPFQRDLSDIIKKTDEKVTVVLCSRRLGKCLVKGTEVLTPKGPIKIEDVKIGDLVYGYNKDGSITETSVTDVIFSGTKEVVDLLYRNKKVASCTKEHVWLMKDRLHNFIEKKTEDFVHMDKIVKGLVNIPHGDIHEQHAYAIGALLGDGCSKQNGITSKQIFISSENDLIPKKIQAIIGADVIKSNGETNYTWCISNVKQDNIVKKSVHCNYYDKWIKNRYAHEKIINLDVIKTWNRESCIALLAGLIDTDGSVHVSDNNLILQISMQAKSVIDAIQYLLYALFQFKPSIIVDDRKKYKNGPCYLVAIKNNQLCKRILKELDQFLITDRKKWKNEYSDLNNYNSKSDSIGVVRSEYTYEEECYDLEIQNDSHLYLLANGLVTHNSYAATVFAIQQCLSKPNSIVKYLAPTKLMVNTYLRPLFREILLDCPEDFKPNMVKSQFTYHFPNGSEIQLAGSDGGHAEKLRGSFADLCIVDEAAFCSDLTNVVRSILIPTTMNTKGKILLLSTPPKDPEHDFLKFVEEADLKGKLIKKTIYDNVRIKPEEIEAIIAAYPGGSAHPDFQREYLCKLNRNDNLIVIPEFTDEIEKVVVKEWPKPPQFDAYESMDLGFKDMTVLLFAYYDFRAAKLIIEDEIIMQGNEVQIPRLISKINEKEAELWTDIYVNEIKKPHLRISDINYIVTEEISRASNWKINFQPAKKDDKDAAVNNVRVLFEAQKIIINPRCQTLIKHVKNAKWASRKDIRVFAHGADGSHFDALDALIYLCRHVDYNRNPYPRSYGLNLRPEDVYKTPAYAKNATFNNTQIDVLRQIFNRPIRKTNGG